MRAEDIVDAARVFARARYAGIGCGVECAARYGALSADHLEYTSDAGASAMANTGTVAVILPGAYYFLRETKLPPIAALRAHLAAGTIASVVTG